MDKEIVKKYLHLIKTFFGCNITISSETQIFTSLSDEIIDKIYGSLNKIEDEFGYNTQPYIPRNDIKVNKYILCWDPANYSIHNVDMYHYYFYNNNTLYRILKCRQNNSIILLKYGALDEMLPFIEKQENIIEKLKNE